MASIWKRETSPYWVACYAGADGRRLKKSTKQSNRDNAMRTALEWESAANRARQGLLTEAQARRVISEIVEKTTGEPLTFYTIEGWLREWLAGKKQTKSAGTHVRYEHVIEDFLAYLGKRAGLNLGQLSPKDISSFREAEQKKKKTGKTCNLAVKIIGGALNAARRQAYITSNPAEALESLPHQSATKQAFTAEQVGDLLKAATSEDWRGAILFAYYTGARLQDVTNMKWDAIDLADKLIRFTPMKTKKSAKEVVIPMHSQLEQFLLGIAGQDKPDAFLFPTLAGRKTGGAHGLSMTFAKIIAKAGIKADVARPKGHNGRALSQLSFHSFRHGFNSAMANKGVAQEVRQKLTGHASPEMNKLYTHHDIGTLRNAVSVIPRVPLGPKAQ